MARSYRFPAFLIVACLICCKGSGAESADAALTRLVVPPQDLPEVCSLRWNVPPRKLTSEDDSRAYFEMALAMWFGEEHKVDFKQLAAAHVNTYAPQWGDPKEMRVSITSLAFKSKQKARSEAEFLLERTARSPIHRMLLADEILVLIMAQPSAGNDCRNWLAREVQQRLTTN